MVSVERYMAALSELANEDSKLIQNGFAMLKANYRSPGRWISATRLSLAADESYTAYGTANIQYGYLLVELLNSWTTRQTLSSTGTFGGLTRCAMLMQTRTATGIFNGFCGQKWLRPWSNSAWLQKPTTLMLGMT
jgi:hypothetical protein